MPVLADLYTTGRCYS